MGDITIRDGDDGFIYGDCDDFTPGEELYIDFKSRAVPPNESTQGVTAGLHKTVRADGSCHFKMPKDYILPDLPREIVPIGPMIEPKVFTS